jgi:hypothetical protein
MATTKATTTPIPSQYYNWIDYYKDYVLDEDLRQYDSAPLDVLERDTASFLNSTTQVMKFIESHPFNFFLIRSTKRTIPSVQIFHHAFIEQPRAEDPQIMVALHGTDRISSLFKEISIKQAVSPFSPTDWIKTRGILGKSEEDPSNIPNRSCPTAEEFLTVKGAPEFSLLESKETTGGSVTGLRVLPSICLLHPMQWIILQGAGSLSAAEAGATLLTHCKGSALAKKENTADDWSFDVREMYPVLGFLWSTCKMFPKAVKISIPPDTDRILRTQDVIRGMFMIAQPREDVNPDRLPGSCQKEYQDSLAAANRKKTGKEKNSDDEEKKSDASDAASSDAPGEKEKKRSERKRSKKKRRDSSSSESTRYSARDTKRSKHQRGDSDSPNEKDTLGDHGHKNSNGKSKSSDKNRTTKKAKITAGAGGGGDDSSDVSDASSSDYRDRSGNRSSRRRSPNPRRRRRRSPSPSDSSSSSSESSGENSATRRRRSRRREKRKRRDERRYQTAMITSLHAINDNQLLQKEKDDRKKSILSKYTVRSESLFFLLSAKNWNYEKRGLPKLNGFMKGLVADRDFARIKEQIKEGTKGWRGKICEQGLAKFFVTGYLGSEYEERPEGLSFFICHPNGDALTQSPKAMQNSLKALFGEQEIDSETAKYYTDNKLSLPRTMDDLEGQLLTYIDVLDLFSRKKGIASEGAVEMTRIIKKHYDKFRQHFKRDPLMGVRIGHFLDQTFQAFLNELAEFADERRPIEAASESLQDFQKSEVTRLFAGIRTSGFPTIYLPSFFSERSAGSHVHQDEHVPDPEQAPSEQKPKPGAGDGAGSINKKTVAAWMIPTGKKFGDFFDVKQHEENFKGFPMVKHHKSGKAVPICIKYQVGARCKAKCNYAHAEPQSLDKEAFSKIATRLKEIYGP